MKWDEQCSHGDIALGYYRPSDDMSEEGSSALSDLKSLSHDYVAAEAIILQCQMGDFNAVFHPKIIFQNFVL